MRPASLTLLLCPVLFFSLACSDGNLSRDNAKKQLVAGVPNEIRPDDVQLPADSHQMLTVNAMIGPSLEIPVGSIFSSAWGGPHGKGTIFAELRERMQYEILDVTGVATNPDGTARVDFTYRFRAPDLLIRAGARTMWHGETLPLDAQRTAVALFRRYDDGWRLEGTGSGR